jgi:hypothetical protein
VESGERRADRDTGRNKGGRKKEGVE